MIALLSPAKNMDFNPAKELIETSTPVFLDRAEYLVEKLRKLSARQVSKMMGISAELGELNKERFQQWQKEAGKPELKPAVLAFSGEVYRNLDAADFSKQAMEFANEHLIILSGLYGLLRPMDNILPYRLEMGSSWKVTPKQNNLYRYWGKTLSEELNRLLASHSTKIVLNLASHEYVKAVDRSALKYPLVNCHFLDWKNGEFKTVMTWAKQARGKMARQISKRSIDNLEDLKKVTFDNYTWHENLSDQENVVFARKIQA